MAKSTVIAKGLIASPDAKGAVKKEPLYVLQVIRRFGSMPVMELEAIVEPEVKSDDLTVALESLERDGFILVRELGNVGRFVSVTEKRLQQAV